MFFNDSVNKYLILIKLEFGYFLTFHTEQKAVACDHVNYAGGGKSYDKYLHTLLI